MATEPIEQVGTRLMFENERVRVWDFALAPGESMEKHVHRLPFFFLVAQGGALRISDPDNPADYHDVHYDDDLISFHEVGDEAVHNRHTNIGTAPYRNYVIELKG